jgi:hypothetical protein
MFAHRRASRKGSNPTPDGTASGPEWVLAGVAVLALFAGAAPALALGFGEASLASGLVSLFVLITAFSAARTAVVRAALAVSAITALGLLLAQLGEGNPVVAALAMAGVMFAAGVSRAGGPVAAAAGAVLGTAYFLPATLNLTAGLSRTELLELSLGGLAAGLVVFAALTAVGFGRSRTTTAPQSGEPEPVSAGTDGRSDTAPVRSGGMSAMLEEIRSGGPDVRYGIRRAVLLGLAVGFYQVDRNQNVFWVMLTIFIVLQPDPGSTWTKSLKRGIGTVAGALAVGMIAQVAPAGMVVVFGVVALTVGLAYYRSNYTIYAAGVTVLTVALIGDQGGDFAEWALLRAADTVIGIAIAIAAVYVILPDRTRPQAIEGASGRL